MSRDFQTNESFSSCDVMSKCPFPLGPLTSLDCVDFRSQIQFSIVFRIFHVVFCYEFMVLIVSFLSCLFYFVTGGI